MDLLHQSSVMSLQIMLPAIAWEKNTTKNTGISWQWTNNSPASNYGSSLNSAITAKLLVLPLTWTAHQDHPLPLALAHLLALFACPPLVQFAPAFAYHCPQQTSSNIEARSGNYGHILDQSQEQKQYYMSQGLQF